MAATEEQKLYPLGDTDWAVPPGETLLELLEERGMSQRELARRTGLSPKHVNKLLHGLVPLSPDVAVRLERVTGVPANFWNRREANYRMDQLWPYSKGNQLKRSLSFLPEPEGS